MNIQNRTHIERYFEEVAVVAKLIDISAIEQLASELVALRERNGRLFLLGVGGSAANCSQLIALDYSARARKEQ